MAIIDLFDKARYLTGSFYEFLKMAEKNYSSQKSYKFEAKKVLDNLYSPEKEKNPKAGFRKLPSIKSSNLDGLGSDLKLDDFADIGVSTILNNTDLVCDLRPVFLPKKANVVDKKTFIASERINPETHAFIRKIMAMKKNPGVQGGDFL